MTAGCFVTEHNEAYFTEDQFNGLVTGHAYTVLGVNEDEHWVVMRNPWATENYHGIGSDMTDDGFFEMPVSEFKIGFPDFTIAYY